MEVDLKHIRGPDGRIGIIPAYMNLFQHFKGANGCRQADVDAMQASGLALGGSPGKNAVVFDGDVVTSPGGLRHRDEPVRHKMLDALGDLALAGAPLIGHYIGYKAGHTLTNMLLRELFSRPGATRMIVCDASTAARLPGHGLVWDEIPAVA